MATFLTDVVATIRALDVPTRLSAKVKRVVVREASVRAMLLRCWVRLKCSRAALPGCRRLKPCTRVHATIPSSQTSDVHCNPKNSLHAHELC